LCETANQRAGNGKARVSSITYKSADGLAISSIGCGNFLKIDVGFSLYGNLNNVIIRITFYNSSGVAVANLDSLASGFSVVSECVKHVVCSLESVNLIPGVYRLNVGVSDFSGVVDHVISAAPLVVEASNYLGTGKLPAAGSGIIVFRPVWRIISE
jgi:hypothetical protein